MVAASRHAFSPHAAADLLLRAAEFHRRGEWAQAEEAYRRLCALEPRNVHALHLHGLLLTQTGRLEAGLELIDRALNLKPDFIEALNSRGAALQALQRLEAALATYDRALKLNPRFADALINRGVVLKLLERHDEALLAFDRALRVAPGSAEAHQNRGATLRALQRHDEALQAYDRALAIRPSYVDALSNRGATLMDLGRFGHALADLDRALALAPEHAVARTRRGYIALRSGDYAAGWRDYDYRLRAADGPRLLTQIAAPLWRGEPIAGRSILVYDERGLGDVIQFCRYLTPLAQSGAVVAFVVRPTLAALMRMSFPALRVMSAPPPGESFDFQCPLMSLPRGFATTVATIPAAAPYIAADPARAGKWRERLGPGGCKIGVTWSGSPASRREGRSFPLSTLAPLAAIPGVRLISLQKNEGVEEIDNLPAGMKVETLGDDYEAGGDFFLDVGGVMQSLDLVISPDTALAHVAGALARPVWLALSEPADWRWLTDRADSPWYPSARLFRQRARGDWDGVMAEMAAAASSLRQA